MTYHDYDNPERQRKRRMVLDMQRRLPTQEQLQRRRDNALAWFLLLGLIALAALPFLQRVLG